MDSTKKVGMGLLRAELSLYRQIVVPSKAFNPFSWWVEQDQKFPIISFWQKNFGEF
jgi:hypothetical protein